MVDLAAGTGKFTRLLVPTGAELVAVEPVAGMRATLATHARRTSRSRPRPRRRCRSRTRSLDAVTVAQAWHWFDHDRAGAELTRTVRVGGRVGLVWNARDRTEPWVNDVWTVLDRVEKHAPWRDHEHWRDSFRGIDGFGPRHDAEFRHRQEITPDGVVQRVASVSHVAVLAGEEREVVLDEIRALIRTHPDVRNRDTLHIPYRVDCYWFERV